MAKQRRANGEGSFKKRKDGRIEYRVSVDSDVDGSIVPKSFYGKTQTDCRKQYKEWLQNKDKEKPIHKVKTVEEWAKYWLEIYKKDKVAYGTYKNYDMYLRLHIIPELGTLKLSDTRPAHIEKFFSKKTNLSRTAQCDMLTALRGIFATAIDNGFCTSDPTFNIKVKRKKPSSPEVFTLGEIESILNFAPTHEYGHYIEILLYTGMRRGELLALKWGNVDQENGTIKISQAVSKSEDGYIEKGTKTDKPRHVGITPKLNEVLNRIPKRGMYVIADQQGSQRTVGHFRAAYDKFFKDLNMSLKEEYQVKFLSAHKCRHTYATYLLSGGANLRAVQDLLGHSTISMTEVYTHINIEDIKRNVLNLKY